MSDIEDRLASAAARLQREVAATVDADAALEQFRARPHDARSRHQRGPWLLAAASAILVLGAGVVFVSSRDDTQSVISGDDSTGSASTSSATTTTTVAGTTNATFPSTMLTTTSLLAATGDDLVPPTPGWEITFEGAAGRNVGDRLELGDVRPFEGQDACGYWGPQERSDNGDPQPPEGIATGTLTEKVINTVQIDEPIARTASGVGVGTSVTTLQRIYGDRLVIDRADGWESPTRGLLALYQDVAAVRQGERAITFLLDQDRVVSVKISDADSWGDDEGCA